MQTKPKLYLDFCSHKAAEYSVKNWHYSQCMPKSKLVKIGVWEDNKFIGCVIFGSGANNNMLKPYGLTIQEGCELVRVALNNHITPVTKIVSVAIKLLIKHSPGLKLIISYADERQGHIGKIYQAGNWIFTGELESTPEYYINGKWWHQRAVNSSFGSHKNVKYEKTRPGGFRFRYLYPLDNQIKQQIEKLRKPYPKNICGTGVIGNTSTNQVEDNVRVDCTAQKVAI